MAAVAVVVDSLPNLTGTHRHNSAIHPRHELVMSQHLHKPSQRGPEASVQDKVPVSVRSSAHPALRRRMGSSGNPWRSSTLSRGGHVST